MPVLHLDDVPNEIFERIQQMATARRNSLEAEALRLLRQGMLAEPSNSSQAELLADLRRRSFSPPPGTPDSLEWLREDRER